MSMEHASNDASVHTSTDATKVADKRSKKKQRTFKEDALEHASKVLDALIEDAEGERKSVITAEVLVRHNLQKIMTLRGKGYTLARIYELFNRQIKLGVSKATFERYVRLALNDAPGLQPGKEGAAPPARSTEAAAPSRKRETASAADKKEAATEQTASTTACPSCGSDKLTRDAIPGLGKAIWNCGNCNAAFDDADGALGEKLR